MQHVNYYYYSLIVVDTIRYDRRV